MLMQLGMGSEGVAGPSADPSSVTATIPVASVVVAWTNGDAAAQTQIGQSIEVATEPVSVNATVDPGETSYDTGVGDVCPFWWVRHKKGGQVGNWVAASDSFNRSGCPA